ncbi:MAG: GNAT family N-acetyltransferase [Clostridiales bacterium]|jgi:hypothetical protein|nr:GNAT family N-acetyltransferase [Clostridiales bacterium]
MIENSEELKAHYADGFPDDSPGFTDFFFDRFAADSNNVLTYRENGRLISAGYIVEKRARLFGRERTFPYMTALSTVSGERGKNKIVNVLRGGFYRLRKSGYAYFGLYPFSYDYYKRFSFADISFAKKSVVAGGEAAERRDITAATATKRDIESMARICAAMESRFDNSLICGEKRARERLDEYSVDGTPCSVLSLNGVDFAFAYVENGHLDYYACHSTGVFARAEPFKGLTYYDFDAPEAPYLQGRIVDAERALLDYPYAPNLDYGATVKIADPMIEENDAAFAIKIKGGAVSLKRVQSADSVVGIDVLTARMFLGGGGIFSASKNFFCDNY